MNRFFSAALSLLFVLSGAPSWADSLDGKVPFGYLERDGAFAAQESPRGVGTASGNDPELEARIRELEARRAEVDLNAPKKKLIAGGVVGGVGLLAMSVLGPYCQTQCNKGNATGVWVGSAGVAAAGLATMAWGYFSRGDAQEEVNKINGKINSLLRQREAALPRVDAQLTLGDDKMLTLSWRF